MAIGKLILTPTASSNPPTPGQLLDTLISLAFIEAAPLPARPSIYLAGERFLQLITFLGCSPYVRLTPETDDDEQFTHMRLAGPLPDNIFRTGRNTLTPRCPKCREKLTDWHADLTQWRQNSEHTIDCPACNTQTSPLALNWRSQAGAGQLFIEVWGIFPGEAVPTNELLSPLTALGCDWDYFYIQEEA
ncbi:MAG: hypothetical protein MI754_10085 [Chromatiales bacterium]|nr:hypothetical protein [Chromatiales bacterium]